MRKILFWSVAFLTCAVFGFWFIWNFDVFLKPSEQILSLQEEFVPARGVLPIPVMIVPDHPIAGQAIREIFDTVRHENLVHTIDRVVILGSNHLDVGQEWLASSKQEWTTESGKVFADETVIHCLGDEVSVQENGVFSEHDIVNLVSFAEEYFPGVKIAPIVIRDGIPEEKLSNFISCLTSQSENALVILSANFSRSLEKNFSDFHDRKAVQTISGFDYDSVSLLDVDCVAGLRVAMRYAENLGTKNFHLTHRLSLPEITGEDQIGKKTSYVAGYFSNDSLHQVVSKQSVFLLFAGDAMFDRDVRSLIDRRGSLWITKDIERMFLSQDRNIFNLEGAVTKNFSVSLGAKRDNPNHYRFTFDPDSTRDFLQKNRFQIAHLGNNHLGNFGEMGASETKVFLNENRTAFFGDPFDIGNISYETEIRNTKIAFVSYNGFSSFGSEKTIENIQSEHEKGYTVFVYCHWGAEYLTRENENQQILARKFIDAGAEAVIGSHPHVVQPIEIYEGKAIFYSLGNFIFDQYFSEETRSGLLLGVEFEGDETTFVLTPIWTEKDGRIVFSSEIRRREMLDRIARDSTVSDVFRSQIRDGMLLLSREGERR